MLVKCNFSFLLLHKVNVPFYGSKLVLRALQNGSETVPSN